MKQSKNEIDTKRISLGTDTLTIEDVVKVARFDWRVYRAGQPSQDLRVAKSFARVKQSRKWVEWAVKENTKRLNRGEPPLAYYGINTGFGSRSGQRGLPKEDIPWVSRNLIVSHSTGVGDFLDPEIVRAAMLIRANSLAQGYSGVRTKLINILVDMLNKGVIPAIPEYGSVGASGDLAPLSHLAQVISLRPTNKKPIGKPYARNYDESGLAYLDLKKIKIKDKSKIRESIRIDGREYVILNGRDAMLAANIEPIELTAKEGLAFNNGATFSAAIATLALYDAENLARHAEIAAALSMEALLAHRDAFFRHVQAVRSHLGQAEVAQRILKVVAGSNLVDGDENLEPRHIPPQDAYSIRVTPQVLGAVWDVLSFIRETVKREINSATDNPLVFDLPKEDPLYLSRDYRVVSGGNFHGAPLAYAMDFLGIVITDLGSLSERRVFRLTDSNLSEGLPSYLIDEDKEKEGLTSGMMIPQYLAAGLVSDCKTLAHPDSVDSIPTSANQEDHVSMSMNAARHTRKIIQNIENVVAVELLCGYLGIKWRFKNLNMKTQTITNDDMKELRKRKNEQEKLSRTEFYLLNELSPKLGKGTQEAVSWIQSEIYPKLPTLEQESTTEDRFLRPYVMQICKSLHDGKLVNEVYKAIREKLPLRA